MGKTLNAVSHFGPSSLPVVVSQPDERHASGTASVLEWYDRHRAYYNIWFKQRSNVNGANLQKDCENL